MTDDPALLAAIRAAPDDDAPRLVYADWLDEHHQPERAEFIRVQCALARRDDPALRRREAELLAEHHDALAGPLAAPHLRFRFERGWPVAFGHTGLFMRDRRGARSQAFSYYRFNWDFSWWSLVGPPTVEEAIMLYRYFRDEMRGRLVEYRLESACLPVRIWFGPETTASGNLLPNPSVGSPILEVFERKPGRASRKRFLHVHVPDFYSFPET